MVYVSLDVPFHDTRTNQSTHLFMQRETDARMTANASWALVTNTARTAHWEVKIDPAEVCVSCKKEFPDECLLCFSSGGDTCNTAKKARYCPRGTICESNKCKFKGKLNYFSSTTCPGLKCENFPEFPASRPGLLLFDQQLRAEPPMCGRSEVLPGKRWRPKNCQIVPCSWNVFQLDKLAVRPWHVSPGPVAWTAGAWLRVRNAEMIEDRPKRWSLHKSLSFQGVMTVPGTRTDFVSLYRRVSVTHVPPLQRLVCPNFSFFYHFVYVTSLFPRSMLKTMCRKKC